MKTIVKLGFIVYVLLFWLFENFNSFELSIVLELILYMSPMICHSRRCTRTCWWSYRCPVSFCVSCWADTVLMSEFTTSSPWIQKCIGENKKSLLNDIISWGMSALRLFEMCVRTVAFRIWNNSVGINWFYWREIQNYLWNIL